MQIRDVTTNLTMHHCFSHNAVVLAILNKRLIVPINSFQHPIIRNSATKSKASRKTKKGEYESNQIKNSTDEKNNEK